MNGDPADLPDPILLALSTGAAVAVLVEGKAVGGDAWIWGDYWFAERSLEVRFFPGGDFRRVITTVESYRKRSTPLPVFGIIDRDCAADEELDEFSGQGVYRTSRYSVENHLLEPSCWLRALEFISRPRGGLPSGWSTAAEVETRIAAAYQACVPAAAFNRTVGKLKAAHPDLPETPRYIRSTRDPWLSSPRTPLEDWERETGRTDLAARYARELEQLTARSTHELPGLVDGKLVLETLMQSFRAAAGLRDSYPLDQFLNVYLRECPDPPEDARFLVDRILRAAGRA